MPEHALIKVSAVASKLDALSVRDMVEALIAGERDPCVLAGLASGGEDGTARIWHAAIGGNWRPALNGFALT